MTVKAESGKGGARTPGAMKLRHRRWEAARPRPARYPATGAPGSVARKTSTEDPHGSARKTPECARNVCKTLHDKEDDADPVRRSPAARPPSGECCRSDDTLPSVPPRFTDGSDVAHSRLPDVPGEGAAVMPRCGWAGGQKSSYNARYAGVAQLVERRLPKPEVASSRLVARSIFHHRRHHRVGGHGVQVHGQHPKGPQPSTSRSVPGRGSPRISAPGARLISPCFPGNARMKCDITCCRRRVRAVPVAALLAAGLDPPTRAGSVSLRKPVTGSESLPEPGQAHEGLSRACPARKRRVPAQLVLFRATSGPGTVTVFRAAPVGHAGWRHLPSARTTLR